MNSLKHLNIRIIGNVQGVSFRFYAIEKARELGIAGFTRNEPDGSVYIEAEGEETALQKFVEWCKQGPKDARVERVEVSEGKVRHYQRFSVD